MINNGGKKETFMKAAVLKGIEDLEVKEIPRPTPSAHQILIRVSWKRGEELQGRGESSCGPGHSLWSVLLLPAGNAEYVC